MRQRWAIDAVTESLIRQAKIKGVTNEITKITEKQQDLNSNLSNNVSFLDRLIAGFKGLGTVGGYNMQLLSRAAKNFGSDTADNAKKLELLYKTLTDLNTKEATNGTLFTGNPGSAANTKTPKDAQTLEQLFAKINDQAGKDWQKLIDFSERDADKYFASIAKNLADTNRVQKVIDALKSHQSSHPSGYHRL
jgi:phage gp16-like protein